jgi:23S rRNA (adenine2503-C2)-methyltransferase
MLDGLNDSDAEAHALVALLGGIHAKVNLIPFNPHEGSEFERPPEETILAFQDILLRRNIVAIRRASKGQDISAACGQLKGRLDQHGEERGERQTR